MYFFFYLYNCKYLLNSQALRTQAQALAQLHSLLSRVCLRQTQHSQGWILSLLKSLKGFT